MHRRNLLDRLDKYAARHADEAATVERFIEFVQGEPRCFERDCWAGHITGSAWLVDPGGEALLLTHHKKLDIWVQLGGHSDGDPNTQAVALREAAEESGCEVELISPEIFDLDVHEIPARKTDPAHFHFDVRFALRASSREFSVSDESLALAWVEIDRLQAFTDEGSIMRMRRKWVG